VLHERHLADVAGRVEKNGGHMDIMTLWWRKDNDRLG
jgi:hypothetical protein